MPDEPDAVADDALPVPDAPAVAAVDALPVPDAPVVTAVVPEVPEEPPEEALVPPDAEAVFVSSRRPSRMATSLRVIGLLAPYVNPVVSFSVAALARTLCGQVPVREAVSYPSMRREIVSAWA